jgi:hypothetical protein
MRWSHLLCQVSAFAMLVAGSLTLPVYAQTSSNGSVRGYVRDPTGAAVTGATVTAASPESPTTFTAVSDEEGFYRLLDLPPGEYILTAEQQGFSKFVRPGVVSRAGLNLTLDIDLILGAVTETTTVKAETPMLESSSAVHAINIAGEFQRHVPLTTRRDWADSLVLTPGVVGTQNGTGKLFYYLHGSDFSSLVLQIDGADVASTLQNTNGYVSLSTEAIQDVQVKTGAVDASTPIGAGAVVSVVTQSGTNQLKGAAGILFQNKRWNANNAPGGTTNAFEIVQPDAALGGPILKDRAWFFAAYRFTTNSVGLSRTPAQLANLRALVPGFVPFTSHNTASYYFIKASAHLPRSRIEGFWQSDRSPEDLADASLGGKFATRALGGMATGVRLDSVWSNSLTTRVNVSFNNKGISPDLVKDDRPARYVHANTFVSGGRLLGTGALAILDNFPNVADQPAQKVTVSADSSWYRESNIGSHEVQAGIYFQPRLRDRTSQHYINGGYWQEEVVLRDPSNPAAGFIPFHRQIRDVVDVPLRWSDSDDYALYVQDAWRPLKRLTINAGIRADFIDRKDAAFNVRTEHSTEIDPRFGATYVLNDDGRRTIRASWVRVSELLGQTTQSAGTNASGFRDLYDLDLNGTFDTTLITPGVSALSTDRVLDDARHQPHTDEWIVGYSQQLPGQVSVDASVGRREFRDRTALVEINGIYEGSAFRGYRNESFNDILEVTNNVWNWPIYTFLEFQATKQTARFQAIGSFTHQWHRIAGTWQPNDPASFIQPDAFPNSRGIGSVTSTFESQNSLSGNPSLAAQQVQSIDNIVRAGLSYRAPLDIRVATNYTLQSGPWSGPVLTRVAAPDPRFGPGIITLANGRVVSNPLATTIRFANPTRNDGQFQLPSVYTWNLRVGRDLRLGRRRLETALDLFNVTNRGAFQLLEIGGNQTFSPTYRQGRQRQTPRAAQVSVRLVF